MEEIILKKHWFSLVAPISIGLLLLPVAGLGLLVILWAILRFKFDVIKIDDKQLYSRFGLINIDEKMIPLNKISCINVKSDIISNMLGFGILSIQSSALNSEIMYPFIENASKAVTMINEKINH